MWEELKSERGLPIFSINGYSFERHKKLADSEAGERFRYRCQLNRRTKCTASMIVVDGVAPLDAGKSIEHNHPPDLLKLDKLRLYTTAKEEARRCPNAKPKELYMASLENCTGNEVAVKPTSFARAARRWQRVQRPAAEAKAPRDRAEEPSRAAVVRPAQSASKNRVPDLTDQFQPLTNFLHQTFQIVSDLNADMADLSAFITELRELGVFKLARDKEDYFTLKSGYLSPIYVDLRELLSSPSLTVSAVVSRRCFLQKDAAERLSGLIDSNNIEYDHLVGVPYGAMHLGSYVSYIRQSPVLIKRKEAKAYGTKKLIEGRYTAGQRALIIEDVVSTGSSVVETVEVLRKEGLICTDVICVMDREQGGTERLESLGIKLHSVVKVSVILDHLQSAGNISAQERIIIDDALKNPVSAKVKVEFDWSIEERVKQVQQNSLNSRILKSIVAKKTNVCVAIDLPKAQQILKVVDSVKDYVIAVKLHADTIEDFSPEFVATLQAASKEHDFIIFEDRKFADTGNTNELQLKNGTTARPPIISWADVVTAHSVCGAAAVKTLGDAFKNPGAQTQGVLLVAELSSAGALTSLPGYTDASVKLAQENQSTVAGFICQNRCADDPSFTYWSPGVNLAKSSDGKGQQWRDPHKAVVEQGNDIIIVGRGITEASDPAAEAKKYAEAGWKALQNRH